MEAMRIVGETTELHIKSDLRYVQDNMTLYLERNEDTGWYNMSNANLF
jgi:ribonuclease HI